MYTFAMPRSRIVSALQEFFAARSATVVCAYLFGSHARDEARPGSDVDVAVLFRQTPPATLEGLGFDLKGELERALGQTVDLIVLNRASLDLVHRVLRDGVLVAEHDRAARVRFEVQRRNDYFDLLPYLREYLHSTPRPSP